MLDCSKKEGLNHNDWLECQFKKFRNKSYRDVVLHVSIIESTIIAESKSLHPFPCPGEKGEYRSFRRAIDILKEKHKNNEKIKKEIKTIDCCWKKRCELVHGIIKNKLDQDKIKKFIDEIHGFILEVHNSEFFKKIFEKRKHLFLSKYCKK